MVSRIVSDVIYDIGSKLEVRDNNILVIYSGSYRVVQHPKNVAEQVGTRLDNSRTKDT